MNTIKTKVVLIVRDHELSQNSFENAAALKGKN